MKKVLVAGAALMLAGGIASTASFAAVEPGVKITGDARVRFYYADDGFRTYGNNAALKSQTNLDSRVRLTFTGTAAGGSYAVVRMRIAESNAGDLDGDYSNGSTFRNSNIAADMAYIGIPFSDSITLELGRYRSTYGPLPGGYNWFYDDVNLTGARGIIKVGDKVVINPFVEWMNEGQNPDGGATVNGYGPINVTASGVANLTTGAVTVTGTGTQSHPSSGTTADATQDNDTIRFGVHAKAQLVKEKDNNWLIGGMLGYQVDNRNEILATATNRGFKRNDGMFGSFYVNGKSGNFGLVGEISVTAADLNNFNSWESDLVTTDRIGSGDVGFGGFILPNFQIDKLNLALLLGFTTGGFQPDGAFGDGVLLGTIDNSVISQIRIGDYGDWLFGGLVVSYQFAENLKLTGNLLYADISAWDSVGPNGDGPETGFRNIGARGYVANGVYRSTNTALTPGAVYKDLFELNNAWTISALMQYTISKGMDVYLSAGYLKPSIDDVYKLGIKDDGVFAAASRFELKF